MQNKLDMCKSELEALRKELIARACEIAELRKKLADCEEREKQLAATQTQEVEEIDKAVHAKEVTKDKEVGEKVEEIARVSQTVEEDARGYKGIQGDVVEIICTDAAIQSMMQDKERMRREIELEAEIMRLRKENQRIIKERAEYENAIQRALLRGVSSLNVEALRVLRCPPIPCCTPCAPCSTSATETIAVCKREVTVKGCVTHRSGGGRNCSREPGSSTVKRPCGSPCCSAGKSRKSASSNSMLFLLHQGDAENVCGSNNTPPPKVCGSPMIKKIEIPPCPRFR